ncbi:hypothetical protein V492_07764 [Pseudogymnoascus sp. VKM F-4246]|nr:hypothetical protein V492_07764 [Pseudogymnoascus sp. VKM F-4246]
MATSQSSQQAGPPYPSYEELQSDMVHIIHCPDAAKRLFWPLDGVFPTSISVMRTSSSPDSLESYFQPDTEGNSGGKWHEISQLPLTEPKVSSVQVSVYHLDEWEDTWLEHHRGHIEAEYVRYGDMSDDDRPYPSEMNEDGGWDSDSDTEYLVGCCGEDRPTKNAAKLVVKPSVGNDYVTVHDYVSAVHPWLMSMREDILKATMLFLGNPRSPPTDFMVKHTPQTTFLEEKEDWVRRVGRGPPKYPIPPSFLEKLRSDYAFVIKLPNAP